MNTTMGHIGISLPNINEGIEWYVNTFDLYQLSDILEASIENEGIYLYGAINIPPPLSHILF